MREIPCRDKGLPRDKQIAGERSPVRYRESYSQQRKQIENKKK